LNNFLETLKKLGPARLAVMGGVMVGLLLFFVFLSMRVSTPSMELLYEDLSTVDSSAIATKLSSENIRYSISPDGTSVSIPSDEVARARMLLAEEGLPNGASLGYELFDEQSGFGTTNFVQNINQVRALEGELARTISSLEAIRNARVHIVLPQRALFSRETTEARASVMINVRPGNKIEKAQANSIQFLIASAIPNMKASSVSIVDQTGTLLARGDEDEETVYDNRTMDMRRNIENRLRQNIEEIIGQIVGFGKVRATVSADLNFDRITTNEELYDPETQVVRSSQITEESSVEREAASNEVGVGENLPAADANLLLDDQQAPSAESNRLEEVTNYEISRTIRNMVSEVGEVRKLSVAVLVDGTYETTTNEEGEEVKTYQPRSQQQLDQIAALVSSSVGIDETRGDTLEIVNMQFADIIDDSPFEEDTILGFKTKELTEIAQLLIVTIAVLLVVLLVLRPMVGRILDMQDPREEDDIERDLLTSQGAAPALTGPSGESIDSEGGGEQSDEMVNMMSVDGKVKASSLKKVEDIVSAYPNETVSVLRSWMSQES
jgi:flagellar M-ring protein FliF